MLPRKAMCELPAVAANSTRKTTENTMVNTAATGLSQNPNCS